MECKGPDKTLRTRGMNLNLCIFHLFEDTVLLGTAHIDISLLSYSKNRLMKILLIRN